MSKRLRFMSFILSFCFVLPLLAGCTHETRDFPELPPRITETEETEILPSGSDIEELPSFTEITVALPYSSETINYLSHLYYAKLNNLMGDDNGGSISLDYLNSLDIPWIINSVQTPSEGVDSQAIVAWDNSGSVPDIFLVSDINSAIATGLVSEMDSYLADNALLASSEIPVRALTNCMSDGHIYGVPHYISILVMVGNEDYIPSTGVIPFRNSVESFEEYLYSIDSEYNDEESLVVPFFDVYGIENLVDGDFDDLYESGLISDYDSLGSDAIVSRNAGLWITSSSDIASLNSYYPDKLYFTALPYTDIDNPPVPLGNIYSLCMSGNIDANAAEFAADFAAFVSLDTDAQLMIRRLNDMPGLLPITENSQVWDLVNSEPMFGSVAMLFEQQMDNVAFYSLR